MNKEDYIMCIGKPMQRKTRYLIDNLQHENKQLQERIDKAIKYIKSYYIEFGELVHYGDSLDPHELISLLKGEELDEEGE